MSGLSTDLKLLALDREGLDVISAHVQNSCARRKDFTWLSQQKRFLLQLMRYDWAAAKLGRDERIGSILRFDRVGRVSHLGLLDGPGEEVLNLLGVRFERTDPPSGLIVLAFRDGALLRLEVECVEAELRDIGPRRPATACAGHALTLAESS